MKIIVDAMSGDNAPVEIVKGALEARAEAGADVVLTGRGEDILRCIDSLGMGKLPQGVEISDATEVIDMDDDPATAVRVKKDASMTVGLNMLRDGHGDAMVSAGSTGALLSGATLIVKRVRGIRRAAMAPIIPNSAGGFILIDCGANTECTPEYLLQFAFMGSFYAEDALGLSAPRVALLNNGTERAKGTPLQREAYELLEKAGGEGTIKFIGNVEGKEAMLGACDVLVTDGFTGNIMLKSVEGAASLIMSELKGIYKSSIITKISALMIKTHILALRARMDSATTGGTMLLGISKPVIKAHGSSKAPAIRGAIRQAVSAAGAATAQRLHDNMSLMTTQVRSTIASGEDGEERSENNGEPE
jgi:glycerol-3-phosphate acyltransferase PlsX